MQIWGSRPRVPPDSWAAHPRLGTVQIPPRRENFPGYRLAAIVKSACLCAASLPHSGIKKRDGSIWASDSDGKLSCDMWLSFWGPCGNTQICASPSVSIFCRVSLQVCSLSFLLWFLHPVTLQPSGSMCKAASSLRMLECWVCVLCAPDLYLM